MEFSRPLAQYNFVVGQQPPEEGFDLLVPLRVKRQGNRYREGIGDGRSHPFLGVVERQARIFAAGYGSHGQAVCVCNQLFGHLRGFRAVATIASISTLPGERLGGTLSALVASRFMRSAARARSTRPISA